MNVNYGGASSFYGESVGQSIYNDSGVSQKKESDIRSMMFGGNQKQQDVEPEEDSDTHIMRMLAERRKKQQEIEKPSMFDELNEDTNNMEN